MSYVNILSNLGDGTVDFNEFLEMMSQKMKTVECEDEIQDAFRVTNY